MILYELNFYLETAQFKMEEYEKEVKEEKEKFEANLKQKENLIHVCLLNTLDFKSLINII